MRCPDDGAELYPQVYEAEIEVDTCPVCAGIWLDRGELEAIQATTGRDYSRQLPTSSVEDVQLAVARARAQAAPTRSCPSCSVEMRRLEHGYCSQILVDVCPDCCGVWLDHGEVRALELFFERLQGRGPGLWRAFFGLLGPG